MNNQRHLGSHWSTKPQLQADLVQNQFWHYSINVSVEENRTRLEILSRPKAPKILQELLGNSEELLSPRPTKLLKDSKRFQKIQKIPEDFKKIPKDFKRFQKIPKDSKRFQKIPKDSKRFQKNPKESKLFQKNLRDSKRIKEVQKILRKASFVEKH